MFSSNLDFEKISKAIEETYQKLKTHESFSNTALDEIERAKNQLKQAMEYSLSQRIGRYY